jgi:hypothetical protein
VNAAVLSIYSFIAPLLTERTGLPPWTIPVALVLFGVGALAGSVLGGGAGDRHPFGTPLSTVTLTLVASIGLCLFSTLPALTVLLFSPLGLVGLSANPVLINLAVRYGRARRHLGQCNGDLDLQPRHRRRHRDHGRSAGHQPRPARGTPRRRRLRRPRLLPLGVLTVLEYRTTGRPTALLPSREPAMAITRRARS